MPGHTTKLYLDQLGPSEQAAVRTLLDTFRDHGWRDTANAALAAVRLLECSPRGLSSSGLAAALPDRFYVQNSASRRELAAALDTLALGSGVKKASSRRRGDRAGKPA